LGSLVTSDPVNLEIDTVARYVERMLQFESLTSAQKDHP
jgi:riboflavin synthase alpha subunit